MWSNLKYTDLQIMWNVVDEEFLELTNAFSSGWTVRQLAVQKKVLHLVFFHGPLDTKMYV